jgi:hypothetical protein
VEGCPIKVDLSTDQLIAHAAHFLGKAKKNLVDAAVREYFAAHRAEINAGIREALSQLDGSSKSAISLLTDIPADQLDDCGGLPSERTENLGHGAPVAPYDTYVDTSTGFLFLKVKRTGVLIPTYFNKEWGPDE